LALAYLAAALRAAGASVQVVDRENQGEETLLRVARDLRPHLVGVSVAMPMLKPALELAARLRRALPDSVLAAGGPLTHTHAPELLTAGGFDLAVQGEGEAAVIELARVALEGRPGLAQVTGLAGAVLRLSGGVHSNPPRRPDPDLDALPMPALDLLPAASRLVRHPLAGSRGRAAALLTSRGCVYHCRFCYQYPFKQVYRQHSPERVVEEMTRLNRRYGTVHFRFLDDLFTLDRARTLALCQLLCRRLPGVSWHCGTRLDLLDRELLRELAGAGCRVVNFGLESGDPDDLARLSKTSRRDPTEVVQACVEAGIDVIGQFILGFPWDTRGSMLARARHARRLPLRAATFWPLIPFPGTPLYEEALRTHGEFDATFFEHTGLDDPGPLFSPVYSPPGLTRREVGRYAAWAQLAFHARPGSLVRLLSAG
jgi:magnesium-protoporphyrin IX monomethyl ester (oxidative) cyclase